MFKRVNLKKVYGFVAMFGFVGLLLMVVGVVPMFAQGATNVPPGLLETLEIEKQAAGATPGGFNWGIALGILGAAVATFGGGFGSSVGVGISGEVGNGVLSEDEKKFGSVLILQALPATQGIYGMLIAFIILGKLTPNLTMVEGMGIFFAALPLAITALISGIWQGKVSAASMQLIARRPKQMGQAIILPAMVETFAVFGLLVSILLLGKIGG